MKELKETRQRLLDTAIELFSKNGFKGTSIRDIAKSSGMTNSNLYYYFGNKDGIVLAILEEASKTFIGKLREAARSDLEPIERFKALVNAHLDEVEEQRKEARVFFLDKGDLPAAGTDAHKQFQKDVLNLYRQELESLRTAGYITHDDLTNLAFNILGVLNWHFRWYKTGSGVPLDKAKDRAITFILNAILDKSGDPIGCNKQELDRKREPVKRSTTELMEIRSGIEAVRNSVEQLLARLKSLELPSSEAVAKDE